MITSRQRDHNLNRGVHVTEPSPFRKTMNCSYEKLKKRILTNVTNAPQNRQTSFMLSGFSFKRFPPSKTNPSYWKLIESWYELKENWMNAANIRSIFSAETLLFWKLPLPLSPFSLPFPSKFSRRSFIENIPYSVYRVLWILEICHFLSSFVSSVRNLKELENGFAFAYILCYQSHNCGDEFSSQSTTNFGYLQN